MLAKCFPGNNNRGTRSGNSACKPNVSLGTIREGQGLETPPANCPDFAAQAGDSLALRLLSDLVSSWGALMGPSCMARARPLSDSL